MGTQTQFETERFLLPKLDDYGVGYTLNFNNFTIRGMTSDNAIQSIRVLSVLPQPAKNKLPTATASAQIVTKLSPVLYKATITEPISTLAFLQAFERGWIAITKTNTFPFFEFAGHHGVLNGWANGWTKNFSKGDILYILFWPQLLQWLGFIV